MNTTVVLYFGLISMQLNRENSSMGVYNLPATSYVVNLLSFLVAADSVILYN